jgi:hypothetical protein
LLRTQRLKSGLDQKDLTALVPRAGRNRVSRVERTMCPPNAREILAYQLIFGTLPEELFPGLVADVQEEVLRNARRLHARLEESESAKAARTRAFIEAIFARTAQRARLRGV